MTCATLFTDPNIGVVTLRAWANSWGTGADTIVVKIATSGSAGSNAFQYNARYRTGWRTPPILVTVMEVETDLAKATPNGVVVKQVASKTITSASMNCACVLSLVSA